MIVEPKYHVGDNIFYMHDNRIRQGKIESIILKIWEPQFLNKLNTSIQYTISTNYYTIGNKIVDEIGIFSSKEELLKTL